MNRCGITRQDGVVRIGILCDQCSLKAAEILKGQKRGFWIGPYVGPESCEACYMDEYNNAIDVKE